MIETKSERIDGHEFSVTQLPGRRGFRFANRVLQIAAPVLAKAAGAVEPGKGLGDINIAKLEPALLELAQRLEPEVMDSLLWEALSSATMDGQPLTPELFDVAFSGKPFAVYKLFVFALKVQAGDFFSGLSGLAGKLNLQGLAESRSEG